MLLTLCSKFEFQFFFFLTFNLIICRQKTKNHNKRGALRQGFSCNLDTTNFGFLFCVVFKFIHYSLNLVHLMKMDVYQNASLSGDCKQEKLLNPSTSLDDLFSAQNMVSVCFTLFLISSNFTFLVLSLF